MFRLRTALYPSIGLASHRQATCNDFRKDGQDRHNVTEWAAKHDFPQSPKPGEQGSVVERCESQPAAGGAARTAASSPESF